MLQKLWTLGIVALPIAVLFGPSLITDTSYAMRDAAHFYHPLFEWTTREWAEGRVPLWNPQENCGVPVLADATSSVFYPGKLVFALPVEFALRYKLYIVGHVALAAATAFYLARRFGASPAAAALGAIAYSCGGSVVFQYCNVIFLVSAALLPLAVLATDRLMQLPSWQAALGLATTLALMILGGDPQMAFHVLLMAAGYGVCLSWRSGWGIWWRRMGFLTASVVLAALLSAVQLLPSMEAASLSERTAFHRPRNVYEAAAVMFSPETNLPRGETLAQAVVGGLFCTPREGSHHELIYEFSIGPWRLLELFWPNIGGRMFPLNRRWMSLLPAEGRIWSPSLYMGLLPIALAGLTLATKNNDVRVRWLQWVAILFTVGSFGYYGLGWLLQELHLLAPVSDQGTVLPAAGGLYWLLVTLLPTYNYFRYPAKLLTVAALAISLLAAAGFDHVFYERRPGLTKTLQCLGVLSTLAAILLWLFGGLVVDPIQATDSTLGPFDGRGARHDVLFALLHFAVVDGALVGLLSQAWTKSVLKKASGTSRQSVSPRNYGDRLGARPLFQRTAKPRFCHGAQLAAVTLTALELSVANSWLIFTCPSDSWSQEPLAAAEIRVQNWEAASEVTPPRVYRGSLFSWRPPGFARAGSAERMSELVQWEHDTLFPKHHLSSGLSLVESYGSLKLLDYESLMYVAKQNGRRRSDKTIVPNGLVLRMLATKFLVLPQTPTSGGPPPDPWPEGTEISRMYPDSPRTWIVHDVQVMAPLTPTRSIEAVDQRTAEILFPKGKIRDYWVNVVIETSNPPDDLRTQHPIVPLPMSGPGKEWSRVTHYDPQHVVIEAELEQAGLVILADSFYPGWRAFVSTGEVIEEAPIYRVNRVQRGVWLPKGRHVLEYFYEPWSFYSGAAISAAAWLLLGLLMPIWLTTRWFKSSSSAPASVRPAPRPESASAASPS